MKTRNPTHHKIERDRDFWRNSQTLKAKGIKAKNRFQAIQPLWVFQAFQALASVTFLGIFLMRESTAMSLVSGVALTSIATSKTTSLLKILT